MKRMMFAAVMTVLALGTAQAQPMPPKPGAEHDALKKLVGTWEMTMKEGGQEMKGTSVNKMDLGGLWLSSTVEMDFGAFKFSGHGMDSYDATKKKYVGVWMDSMSTSPLVMEGTYDKEKKTMTMTGEGPGPDGKPTKHTMTTVWTDDDNYSFSMAHGTDKPMMTIEYKRKK